MAKEKAAAGGPQAEADPFPVELMEERCPKCSGTGRTRSGGWDEWRAACAAADAEGRARPAPPYLPEEVRCDGCRGVGSHPTPPGRRVLDFVARHLGLR